MDEKEAFFALHSLTLEEKKYALEAVAAMKKTQEFAQKKGIQYTEYTYIYLLRGGYFYARVDKKKLLARAERSIGESRYHKESLKTKDLEEAKKNAIRLEQRLTTLSDVGKDEVDIDMSALRVVMRCETELRARSGADRDTFTDYANSLQKNFYPFLMSHAVKKPRDINTKTIYQYFLHLKSEGKLSSGTSVNVAKTAIREFFRFCLREDLIKKEQQPDLPTNSSLGIDFKKKEDKSKRRPFEYDDLVTINENFDAFYLAIERKKPQVLFLRTMLRHYFDFLCAMGCRPGEETINLRFTDITKEKGASGFYYTIGFNFGKSAEVGKSRRVELHQSAVDVIKAIASFRFGQEMGIDDIMKKKGYVFYDEATQTKPAFERTWGQYRDYLNEKNLLKQKDYTLYSCRHEYINLALDVGRDIRDIARHCGNSTATIEQHYEEYCIVRQKSRRKE